MTDLEITKLCAEAMGYEFITSRNKNIKMDLEAAVIVGGFPEIYQPLRNDAQAMALVKNFGLNCGRMDDNKTWYASKNVHDRTYSDGLNRAICECCARMQQAKG